MIKLFKFPAVLAAIGALVLLSGVAQASVSVPKQHWSFSGMFGTFDRAAAQRGFQIYKQVCASCHSLRLVNYRNLSALGFSEEQIKTIAGEAEVADGPNDEGEMFTRPAKPADKFVSPFANDNAARAANNGALPPDLSLITKARVGGPDYIYAILTGYAEAPAGVSVPEGMSYHSYFPGHQIAMAPPLADDAVEYQDGTKATLVRMTTDVVTFLSWAAEPELEQRKSMGIKVLLFLIVFSGLLFAVKKKIWADLH